MYRLICNWKRKGVALNSREDLDFKSISLNRWMTWILIQHYYFDMTCRVRMLNRLWLMSTSQMVDGKSVIVCTLMLHPTCLSRKNIRLTQLYATLLCSPKVITYESWDWAVSLLCLCIVIKICLVSMRINSEGLDLWNRRSLLSTTPYTSYPCSSISSRI